MTVRAVQGGTGRVRTGVRGGPASGGGGAANPAISTLSLLAWHDPSNASNITQASGLVSSDADLSSNNLPETAATTARPTLTASAIGGLSAETFDGSANFLTSSLDLSASAVLSFIYLIKPSAGGGTSGTRTLASAKVTGGPQFRTNGTSLEFVNEATAVLATGTAGAVADATSAIVVGSFRKATGAYSFRSNGTAFGSGTVGATTFVTSTGSDIGHNNFNGGEAVFGIIAERLTTFDDTLSNVQLIEGYLAWKWGLTGSLPGGHPWKSTNPYP